MDTFAETLAWVPTVDRRASGLPDVLRIGSSVVHCGTGRVETPRGEKRLRAKELELIVHLYAHLTETFSRERLLQVVWNYQAALLTRTVDQTVATLRKKIETDPERPRFLQTVYGVGYRLVA